METVFPATATTTRDNDLSSLNNVDPPSSDTPMSIETKETFLQGTIVPTSNPQALSTVEGKLADRTQYAISVKLNYEQHSLSMDQTITYVNLSSDSLQELLFVVEPNRQPGVFHLNHLGWSDGQLVEGYTLESTRLHIPLTNPLTPGDNIALSMSYVLNLNNQPGILGYTDHQINLGGWYPFIPPYLPGHGWLVHERASFGEHLVYDVSDYQIDIILVESPPNLIIAASALAEIDGNRYRYHLDAARNFTWSASTEYQVFSESVGSVTVLSYAFPEHVAAGKAALSATSQALTLYSQLFYPYPHASLSVVEADFFDGMEYDGLSFLGGEYYDGYTGGPQDYLTAIAVHEVSHQWWYGLVGNDQAIEPWLDEALATYSELLFYEHIHPELVDWWWDYRVNRFHPLGPVNSTIYDHAGFRSYVDAVYLRGALFLQETRNLIGDETFFEFVQQYAERNVNSIVTGEDFFSELEYHSKADPSELIATYFYSNE